MSLVLLNIRGGAVLASGGSRARGGFGTSHAARSLSSEAWRPLPMPEEANRSWRLRHGGCQQGLGPGDKTLAELPMPSKQAPANSSSSSTRWYLLLLCLAAKG